MFGRSKPPSDGEPAATPARVGPAPFVAATDRPLPPRPVTIADTPAATPQRPVAPPPAWGSSTPPQPPRRPAEPIRSTEPPQEPARDVRKLIVGREINLSGEIAACDHLVVDGTVEAQVRDCFRLEVTETGLFQGAVEMTEADIAGRFIGELIVHGRLSIRATGRIEGKVQYGELAVDAGGTLDGEVRVSGKARPKLVAEAVAPDPGPRRKPPAVETKPEPAPAPEEPPAPPAEAPNLL